MLIEFKVSNYRSIAEEQIISLIPSNKQKEHPENIILQGKHQALNALALYGSNSGGKSNLLKSMRLFDKMINKSARASSTTKLPYDPFLLRSDLIGKPTTFELTFVANETRYRYGFEYTEQRIETEWLLRKNTGREVVVFEREKDVIDVSSGFNGTKKLIDAAIEATRDNALFLSTCDMLNVEEAKEIMQWFSRFSMVDGLNTDAEELQTVALWNDMEYREKIRNYIQSLNLGLTDIDITTKEFEVSELPLDMPVGMKAQLSIALNGAQSYNVLAHHKVYDNNCSPSNNTLSWKWEERESSGAQKALQLSGPIIWALANGGVLIIDEIEAKLHPIMTLNTIDAFLNKQSNPNNAQLIFATHDTNLLSYSSLRRDQICFAEKNKFESTELYALSDFVYMEEKNGKIISEKERPDTDKEKRYFEGRYGAIPMLGDFKNYLRTILWQLEES